eukprot:3327124-Pleurochrysis_carterae.AAC.3
MVGSRRRRRVGGVDRATLLARHREHALQLLVGEVDAELRARTVDIHAQAEMRSWRPTRGQSVLAMFGCDTHDKCSIWLRITASQGNRESRAPHPPRHGYVCARARGLRLACSSEFFGKHSKPKMSTAPMK